MGVIGQGATAYADGMYFLDIVCNGHEGGHGAEGLSHIIGVEAGDNDADTAMVGQFLYHFNDAFVKELCFVDTDYLYIGLYLEHAGGRFDGRAGNAVGVVRDYVQV